MNSAMSSHWGFILAAYGASMLLVVGLVVRAIVDGRAQRRALAALEARGAGRRSPARGSGERTSDGATLNPGKGLAAPEARPQ